MDHTQRLNLHAVLGAQRADVGAIRAIWAIQDRIALTGDEENTLELRREALGDQERVVWNASLSLPAKEFEFSESEVARVRGALLSWVSYSANADKPWLRPLLDALFDAEPVK